MRSTMLRAHPLEEISRTGYAFRVPEFAVRVIDVVDGQARARDVEVVAQMFAVDENWVIFYADQTDNSSGVAAFPTPRVISIFQRTSPTSPSHGV